MYAQKSIKDSSISLFRIGATGGYCLPTADMQSRFGNFATAGGIVGYKLANNLSFDAQYNFLFGNAINEVGILSRISTPDGYVINGDGEFQVLNEYMRGHVASIGVSKVTGWLGRNPNSGIFFTVGGGYMLHRIRYYQPGLSPPPQLNEEYVKGYDRLTAGPMIREGIGYLYLDNRKYLNFSVSIQATQGFTKSLRSWNTDQRAAPEEKRLDSYLSINTSWFFLIYKQSAEDTYYIY